jgi:cytochrome c oxidase subunit 2
MWFTPVKTLETFVVCAQLCGEGHGNMIGSMEVIPKAQFDTWFKSQTESALKSNSPKTAPPVTAKN